MFTPGSVTMTLLAMVVAYLIGSVSFAVVVSRVMGLADPHSYGSGNPGATNVLRTGNRKAALFTLIGDVGKGVLAVLLAKAMAPTLGLTSLDIALVGLAVFVGHLFPLFHGFAGGKGVATAAGVLIALNWGHGLATLATWLIFAYFFRYSSRAALVAAVFAPFYWFLLFGPGPQGAVIIAISALLIWRHRGNIAKLLAGKESRIGSKSAAARAQAPGETSEGSRPRRRKIV